MKRNRALAVALPLYKEYDKPIVDALPLAVGHFDGMLIKVPSLHERPAADVIGHPLFRAAIEVAVNAKMWVVVLRNLWDRWTDANSEPNTIFDYRWYAEAISEVNALAETLTAIYDWKIFSGEDGEPMVRSPQLFMRDHWLAKYARPVEDAIGCAVDSAGIVDFISPCDSFGPESFAWRMQRLGAKKCSRKTYYEDFIIDDEKGPIFSVPYCVPPAGQQHIIHFYQHWITGEAGRKGISPATALLFNQRSLTGVGHRGFLECEGNIFCMKNSEQPDILKHIHKREKL